MSQKFSGFILKYSKADLASLKQNKNKFSYVQFYQESLGDRRRESRAVCFIPFTHNSK